MNEANSLPRRVAPQLLPLAAVAKRLALSVKTVRRMIERSELAAHKVGSSLRVSEEDLRSYVGRSRL